jgi:F0F1-type ATP synthase assembly protein I
MDKKPQTFTAALQSVFTTSVLLMIVGVLLGMIAARLITMH